MSKFKAIVGSKKLEKVNGDFKLLRYVEIKQDDGSFVEFRDHCWISYNWSRKKNLDRLELHQVIEFEGEVYEYIDRNLQKKKCIKNIKKINVIGYKKLK